MLLLDRQPATDVESVAWLEQHHCDRGTVAITRPLLLDSICRLDLELGRGRGDSVENETSLAGQKISAWRRKLHKKRRVVSRSKRAGVVRQRHKGPPVER